MRATGSVPAALTAVGCAGLLVSAVAQPAGPTLDDLKNATISGIYDKAVTLRNGVYEDRVEAGPSDALCCPTQLARTSYAVQDRTLKLVSFSLSGSNATSTNEFVFEARPRS